MRLEQRLVEYGQHKEFLCLVLSFSSFGLRQGLIMEPTLTSTMVILLTQLLKCWDHNRYVPPDLAKIIVCRVNIFIQPTTLPNFSKVYELKMILP